MNTEVVTTGYRNILLISAIDLLIAALAAAVGLLVVFGGSVQGKPRGKGSDAAVMIGGAVVWFGASHPVETSCDATIAQPSDSSNGSWTRAMVVEEGQPTLNCRIRPGGTTPPPIKVFVAFADGAYAEYTLKCTKEDSVLMSLSTARNLDPEQRFRNGCAR